MGREIYIDAEGIQQSREIPDKVLTQEEINAIRKGEILQELAELDLVLRRSEEDLYNAADAIHKSNVPQIFKERLALKESLRAELSIL